MEGDFESLERCVSVCNVPDSFSKENVVSVVNAHLLGIDGHVTLIEPVLDVGEKKGLRQWIILLNTVNCVATLVLNVRNEEITIDNESFTIEYQSSTSCEVPEHWRELIPKLGCHGPSSPDRPSFHGPSSPSGLSFHRPSSVDGFTFLGPVPPDRPSFHEHTSPDKLGPISEASQDYHEPGADISHTGPGHMPESSQNFPEHIQYPRARFYPYQGIDPLQGDFHSMFMPQFPTNPGYCYPCNYLPDTRANAHPNPASAELSLQAACAMASLPPTIQCQAQRNEAFHEKDPTNDIDLSNQMTHPHIQDRNDDSLKVDEDDNHIIVVSKIPEVWLDEERIKMIFESRKYGGFEVAGVTIKDRNKAEAIVEFVDAEACEKVFQKCPINVGGSELHLDIYIPEQEECYECDDDLSDEIKNSTKILVSNLPPLAHDSYLEIFFESKKLGGWSVVDVEMIENEAAAIVEFEHSEAVCDIMKHCPIQMMDKTVDVEIYKLQPVSRCTIEVRGPQNVVTKDQLSLLQLYFENTRRSGGSDIVNIYCDDEHEVVYITYQSEEVAQRVVGKSPHVLKTEKLTVQLHVPNRKLPFRNSVKNIFMGDKDEESSAPLCTVMVKGYPKSKGHDTLEFYFDNKRRSGGGGVVTIQSGDDDDENVLFVTFENEEAAKEVASRSHTFQGYDLAVALHIPPKPKPCYEDRVLIKNIQSTTIKDGLFNFLEAKTGCIPKAVTYHAKDKGIAMVTFENLDFEKMEENLNKYKLEGASLQISRIFISNCIVVSNLASGVTRDMVQYYFENTRKSGGGQVDKVVMQLDQGSCLVFFKDFHVIDKVLNRDHTMSEQKLGVHRYQECLGQRDDI